MKLKQKNLSKNNVHRRPSGVHGAFSIDDISNAVLSKHELYSRLNGKNCTCRFEEDEGFFTFAIFDKDDGRVYIIETGKINDIK